jgi:hypothetical protein
MLVILECQLMHNINQIESRLGHFTVMMAVRFQSESCPTWEPFNLISKDKKEGQMLSSFYAHQLSIIMQSMWACTYTHTQFPLITQKMQSVLKNYIFCMSATDVHCFFSSCLFLQQL